MTGAWANQSVELLDHMMAMEPECEMYALMKAQALIVNRQKQEASWIMEDYKRGAGTGRRRNGDTICICAH